MALCSGGRSSLSGIDLSYSRANKHSARSNDSFSWLAMAFAALTGAARLLESIVLSERRGNQVDF